MKITITTIEQASTLIGCVAGDMEHTDALKPDMDLSLLDDRRFTACGVSADGRPYIGIGHHSGPGMASALVFFLPFTVDVIGLRRTKSGQWAHRGKRSRSKPLALRSMAAA